MSHISRLEIIKLIEERPGITAREISLEVGIHIKNVQGHLHKIENNGYHLTKNRKNVIRPYHYSIVK